MVRFWPELSSWLADGHLLAVGSQGEEREISLLLPLIINLSDVIR